jgi:glyoxylase-like metal-dependent hydrolase (beta-lactamase superfamily II)
MRILGWLSAGVAALAGCATRLPEVAPVEVADRVYVLRGAAGEPDAHNLARVGHAAFVIGERGAVVVQTGVSYRHGEAIIAAVARVTALPIVLAIITDPAQEYLFGAAAFQARGIPVLMHRRAAELMAARCETCLRNLTQLLGAEEMAGTRVAVPDRLIDGDVELSDGGSPLRVLAADHASAPGALAVFDPHTATLIAGDLVFVERVPDLRDADVAAWLDALARLRATNCARLIPGRGAFGRCTDIDAFARYLRDLDERVAQRVRAGASLTEIDAEAALPQFAHWERYGTLHAANARRLYLRHERRLLLD